MDCSPPGKNMEWVAISFSRGSLSTQELKTSPLHWQTDSLPLNQEWSLMELMSLVNRMLPGRDRHVGLRWSDQGSVSEDVTFEVESWKMRGIIPVTWREFISGRGNCRCRWEGKEFDMMEGQKEGRCAGVSVRVKEDSTRWDWNGRRGPGEEMGLPNRVRGLDLL